MAAQTDAPDDLIAELARLMADDARADAPAKPQPAPMASPSAPVRIPGADLPQSGAAPRPQASPVRIPGGEPAAPAPASAIAEPFNFDFALNKPAGPVTPIAAAPVQVQPAPQPAVVKPVVEESVEPQALDHDSLADLIAAELAGEANQGTPQPEPIPVVTGPAPAEDNFGVPPVFGFGSPKAAQPAATAVTIVEPEIAPTPEPINVAPRVEPTVAVPAEPEAKADPLRDIENLVGSAIRLNQPVATPAAPSPALRSLATPTLPASEPQRRSEPSVRAPSGAGSVDDAILAAAAATGARVEWVNPEGDLVEAEEMAPIRPRRPRGPVFGLSRAVAGPLVAVGLLGAAGVGLYFMLGQSAAPTGPAPLIAADTTAIKEVPEPVEAAPQQSVVFNEIAGNNDGTDEQLVSRDQADEEAVTEAATTAALDSSSGIAPPAEGGTINPNADGLVNRKVRTVTVRPDGTIVSGDDSLAGASILPVDRPNVPEVPGADTSTPSLLANADPSAAGATTVPSTAPVTALPEATAPAVVPVQPGAVVPVVDATGQPIAGRTVTTPLQRPADLQTAAASPAALPAATTPEPTPLTPTTTTPAAAATAAVPAGGSAAAYVQLSSQRSEDAARESAQAIATRYGVLFGGANLEIQRVDLGERGIYFRVLVPAADRAGASNICTNVKAAGGDCLIL
ncbi:SPOR domain-containing protein [Devosia rhizoryzae]|uniref:SPOR domain-containing protein n=1 Tax=Devosia rhizoryzae TaxID=2774137 RepID=A0ABX7C9C7_9HYPH|nr:SPOR domain-containing protein [Devosia rhizoryzae]QQR40823.1 SPOR domain-containing protein [Devosia rhizoryzae]